MTYLSNEVNLAAYDPNRVLLYNEEQTRLSTLLPSAAIEHIGSTSIGGIAAKPIIDVLVGVPTSTDLAPSADTLQGAGYILEGGREGHSWLCRPDPEHREAILHLVVRGENEWTKRITFRDYLREHPAAARRYETFKQSLAKEHATDLGAYTRAKAGFVFGIIALANSGTAVWQVEEDAERAARLLHNMPPFL